MAVTQQKQRIAYFLTFSGAIPFIALIIGNFLSIKLWGQDPQVLFFGYAALIASFISGIHWGLYLIKDAPMNLFVLSNLITLTAWMGLIWSSVLGAVLLVLCFVCLLLIDWLLFKASILELWYMKMRFSISLLVITLLLIFVFFS